MSPIYLGRHSPGIIGGPGSRGHLSLCGHHPGGQKVQRERSPCCGRCIFTGWGQGLSSDCSTEAPRARRCLGLENHITRWRLAPGQGRESARRLAFQETQAERRILGKWKPPGGPPWVFELLASPTLALGPSRVVKTEWLEILAPAQCGQDSEVQRTGATLHGSTSWNSGPGILAPGPASFLAARLPPPLPNGKIHVAFLFDSGRDTRARVWTLTSLSV